jgi:hypothetical protein
VIWVPGDATRTGTREQVCNKDAIQHPLSTPVVGLCTVVTRRLSPVPRTFRGKNSHNINIRRASHSTAKSPRLAPPPRVYAPTSPRVVSAWTKMRSRSSATPMMFQSATVQPHPHCFCPVDIPWAISPQPHRRHLRIPHTVFLYKCLDMLARLAQELSATKVRWGLPLPNLAGAHFEHIFHDCEAPVVALSTALIIFFCLSLFWVIRRTLF